jgi:integrase
LLRAIPDDDLGRVERPMYLAAAMTGMRQGELLALRWRDIDWTARRVRVRRNFVRGEFGIGATSRIDLLGHQLVHTPSPTPTDSASSPCFAAPAGSPHLHTLRQRVERPLAGLVGVMLQRSS